MKRGRENPCFICGHFHKYEEGEVCGICGHRKVMDTPGAQAASQGAAGQHLSVFPSEIIPEFLYLGSYDNASRSELLKAQGISHILNAVPTCPNLYRNSFNYFSMPETTSLPFDECSDFIEQARTNGARVLVHCMSGQSRSPSIIAAYLMRSQGLSLESAVAFVKEKRPSVNITQALMQQLMEYGVRLNEAGRLRDIPPAGQQAQQGALQFDLSTFRDGPAGPATPGLPTFLGASPGVPSFTSQAGFQPSASGFVFGSTSPPGSGSQPLP